MVSHIGKDQKPADNQADNWAENGADVNEKILCLVKRKKRCKRQKDVNDKKLPLF